MRSAIGILVGCWHPRTGYSEVVLVISPGLNFDCPQAKDGRRTKDKRRERCVKGRSRARTQHVWQSPNDDDKSGASRIGPMYAGISKKMPNWGLIRDWTKNRCAESGIRDFAMDG